MSQILNYFEILSGFYATGLTWEEVEDLYEKDNELNRDEPSTSRQSGIIQLDVVQVAVNNPDVLSTLLALSSSICSVRDSESADSDGPMANCWEEVLKVSPRDDYLAFIYALAGLASLDISSTLYAKLSLASANVYFLSLTLPGAKGFHIYDEHVLIHCLKIFTLVERIQNPDVSRFLSKQDIVEIWVRISTFCDNWKLLLRYVHFNDNKEVRDEMLKKLVRILYMNYENGYKNTYAVNLHKKCFEIFEELLHPHNGEPEETLRKILNMTVYLHTFPPKPKNHTGSSSTVLECEHISDWFIQKCMPKYPTHSVKVLKFYIECIITNPVKSWKTEQLQRTLDYAAKYDAAMFIRCNESSVEFLCEAIYSEESTLRGRVIDLISRILQLDSQVEWDMFRHEVSSIPREVHLIKELILSIQDNNNNVKLKAVQALHAALTKGSTMARKIMQECVKFTKFQDLNVRLPEEPPIRKNEIRFEKPTAAQANYTFEGHGMIELDFLHLPEYVYGHLYQNALSHLRRTGVQFVEQLVKMNPLIIYNTNFVTETSNLVNEPVALVRKQTLASIDSILSVYPNCFLVIWVWCKIITPMFKDADPKNIELAIECFKSKVLQNLEAFDKCNKAEHFMPWIIVRTMLSTQSRLYLQTCFHKSLHEKMVSKQMIQMVESHLLTSNSTEAWVLLNFITGSHVKCREPDSLIHLFVSMHSWDKAQNTLIALEVLANCINDFSFTGLNYAFKHILQQLKEGSMMPAFVGKAFDFLLLIDHRSNKMGSGSGSGGAERHNKSWLTELHEHLEHAILNGIQEFPDNRVTMMSHLYAYTEVNLQTTLRPHQMIAKFAHKYILTCVHTLANDFDTENQRLFNSMLVIASRLSLRDNGVARTTCHLFAMILDAIDNPPIVNTIIVALNDLCKKHTQLVENIMGRVLGKLTSPYAVNRLVTFKCFEIFVLQDQVKLRGSLLLALLATILDECEELSTRACAFFAEYLEKKNATLFQKCLVECPFVLNEYTNFDGLDSFSNTSIKSPLSGEEKRKKRHMLYNHIIKDIKDVSLILYFGQLQYIAEKSYNDPLIKTENGLAMIKDILYILKRVCQETKEQKSSSATNGQQDEANNAEESINDTLNIEGSTGDKTAAATAATPPAIGVGRGRKNREVTMPQAMEALEKFLVFLPRIHENMIEHREALQKYFDELGNALNKRFPALIKYAQPAEFWSKYRETNETVTEKASKKQTQKRATKRSGKTGKTSRKKDDDYDGSEEETDPELNADRLNSSLSETCEDTLSSDDDTPLVLGPSTKRIKPTNSAELQIEYLFNPNI